MIYDDIFKNKIPLSDKLLSFGFIFKKDSYVYSCKIADQQFDLIIFVSPNGEVKTKIIDPDTEDEYTLHFAEGTTGKFIGKVRADYFRILQAIADNCFETKIFRSEYANEVIRYIKEKYQHKLEYLWQKFPENAIVRRADNHKWYVVLLTVEKNKIGLEGNGKVEIIDLRIDPEKLTKIVDGQRFFSGYHMNKKHWMTICLDGSVDLRDIFNYIDDSYILAKK